MNTEIKQDPIKDNSWILVSEYEIGPPILWPKLLTKNNREGTLTSKKDWIAQEARKWVEVMKVNPKYDSTPFRYFSLNISFVTMILILMILIL